jgi:hypothetical protein
LFKITNGKIFNLLFKIPREVKNAENVEPCVVLDEKEILA